MKKCSVVILVFLGLISSCKKEVGIADFDRALSEDNRRKVIEMLHEINPDTLRFRGNRNIIHQAILHTAYNTLDTLIKGEYKYLADSLDDQGFMPVHFGFVNECPEEVVEKLINHTSQLNALDGNGLAPIHYSVVKNQDDFFDKLIKKGVNINKKISVYEQTPLHLAIDVGNINAIKKLRLLKAIDTIKDINEKTVIDLALSSGNQEIIDVYFDDFNNVQKNALLKHLIENDTVIGRLEKMLNQKWVSKKSINDGFVFAKSIPIAKLLLNKGVKINHKHSVYGVSALHNAAVRGDVKMIEFLLNNKANVNQVSEAGMTPLLYACKLNSEFSSIGKKQIGGMAIQVSAIFKKQIGISDEKNAENSLASVKLLVENKANIYRSNSMQESALDIARITKNKKVVSFLKEKGLKR